MAPRELEISWDSKVRGMGRAVTGVPQGSPLTLILFLVYMAPILKEMERRIQEEMGGVVVHFPLYMDHLHSGVYDRRGAGSELGKR